MTVEGDFNLLSTVSSFLTSPNSLAIWNDSATVSVTSSAYKQTTKKINVTSRYKLDKWNPITQCDPAQSPYIKYESNTNVGQVKRCYTQPENHSKHTVCHWWWSCVKPLPCYSMPTEPVLCTSTQYSIPFLRLPEVASDVISGMATGVVTVDP